MQPIIKTDAFTITGLDFEDHLEFRGIKYASAGRWEYPKILELEGNIDATVFGACSFQRRAFEEDSVCNPFFHKEFREGQSFTYSEDCQYLNIFAPKDAENCPVVIFIHGGSFTGGSTDEGHLNAAEYAKRGIVFVTFNYRLNAFGFMAHSSMMKDGVCGNYGLYDQEAAVRWVLRNISLFGGDPKNITIMGQSAGAMSVDIQLSNPNLRGVFKHAIMMSGAGLQRFAAKPLEVSKLDKFWDSIAEKAGVKSIQELKTVDEKTLFYAWSDACKENPLSMLYTLPVRDGKIVTKLAYSPKHMPEVPMILGITATDMMPIILEGITQQYAKASAKEGKRCYVYSFDRLLPGDDNGAWHSCDLLYAFNTFHVNWREFEKVDFEISEAMIDAFTAFIKTGNPNCDSLPGWGCGTDCAMHLCENIHTGPLDKKSFLKSTFTSRAF